ncbi:MAG TPA: NUDIX hydrolase [Thermodesulfovibrionales bacterium]|nr:NUDIX hydrolase [Thermodesulfovibrionales bacterium]
MRPGPIIRQVSSGGVIFRENDDSVEIALVAVKDGKVWCLPKGIINKGEEPDETAIREVSEETGLKGRIIEKLGEINYWYYLKEEEAKCRKTVHFYLLEYEGGDISKHDWEVDKAVWFQIDDALKIASHKNERDIIEKAREMLVGKNIKLE